jgi:predicted DNA-binding transcriptional regulator AlpA
MKNIQEADRLVTAEELAAKFAMSPKSVRRKAKEGIFPFVRLSRRMVRYPLAECEAIMQKYYVPALD